MATITIKGTPVNTIGNLPSVGSTAPDATFVKSDMSEISLKDLKGKRVVLNIFPSIDTGTCAMSVRHFNKDAATFENAVVLAVSADLPFAAGRFCAAEGIENVMTASVFRNPDFAKDYGVLITDGPLKGLLARSVVVLDADGKVMYTELVPELTNEPDYDGTMNAMK